MGVIGRRTQNYTGGLVTRALSDQHVEQAAKLVQLTTRASLAPFNPVDLPPLPLKPYKVSHPGFPLVGMFGGLALLMLFGANK